MTAPLQRVPTGPADKLFLAAMAAPAVLYVALIAALLVADASFTTPAALVQALQSREIAFAVYLSLVSCTVTTILALWTAVPLGYVFARFDFPGKRFLDAVLDIPIVLPPLVVGLSLLILFQTPPGKAAEATWTKWFGTGITYHVPSVILAQYAVATAFAVRTMRVTFDQISPRREQVALTLGCSRAGAFWRVALPEARRGVVTAATLCWARALGEFGPVLVFSGATRLKTEVLPTTVFLELSVGEIHGAVAVSLLMVVVALGLLLVVRYFGVGRAV